jgi:asparagine synthase (glutamine-hydrolysing)
LLSHQQGAESSHAEPSLADWTEEFNHLVHDATRIRLRADVPVGAYLSGGLDSTFTSALVKRNFNNLLWTFSIRFSDDRFDETSYQEKAVETLKTNHQSVVCTEKTVGENFPDVIWHTETPILRTAPAPLYQLSRLVRDNHFKVVITGEGADEIFAGYNIFKEDRIRRFWARSPESKLRPLLLQKLYPYIFSRHDGKGKAFLTGFFKKGLTEVRSPAYSHILRWQNTAQLKGFLTAEIQQETGDLHHFIDRYVSMLPLEYMTWDPLTRAQFTEISIFLSNYLLSSQGDRMTMAHSVEGRYPFLDHRLVEFAFRLPPRYRLNGLNEKFLLKQAAKDILPSNIVQRAKQPYRAPISRCFLGANSPDYVHELLSESALRRTGYFDPGKVSRFLAKCRRQDSNLLSERENMALAGMLSTQLVDHLFIRNFPGNTIPTPDGVKISAQ